MPLSSQQKEMLKKSILKNVQQIFNDQEHLYAAFRESGYIKNTQTKKTVIEPGDLQLALSDLNHPSSASTYRVDNPDRLGNTLLNSGFSKEEIQLMPTAHQCIYESALFVAHKAIYEEINAQIIPDDEVEKYQESIKQAREEASVFFKSEIAPLIKQQIQAHWKNTDPLQALADLHKKAMELKSKGHVEAAAAALELHRLLHAATMTYAHSKQTHDDKIQFEKNCATALEAAEPQLSEHRGSKKTVGVNLKKIGDFLKLPAVSQKGEKMLSSPTTSMQLTQKFKENLQHLVSVIESQTEGPQDNDRAMPKK